MKVWPLTLALKVGEDFNRQRWGLVGRVGSAGTACGGCPPAQLSHTAENRGAVQQAGIRKRAPGEDGPAGDQDGRFEVERKTEINAPSAADSPRLGPASLVEGQV